MGDDFEVKIRVYNGRLLKAMRDAGINSIAQLHEKTGINKTTLYNLAAMKSAARTTFSDEWRRSVIQLSEFFRCLPEDLIPPSVRRKGLKVREAMLTMGEGDVQSLLASAKATALPADHHLDQEQFLAALKELLSHLTERERHVVNRMYGLDGKEPQTQREIAREMGIVSQRVHQLRETAFRKLRYPARMSKMGNALAVHDTDTGWDYYEGDGVWKENPDAYPNLRRELFKMFD